jgi:ribosomal protein L7/L12
MLTGMQSGFYDVILVQSGKKRTNAILAVREASAKIPSIPNMLDLSAASRLVDSAPCKVFLGIPKEHAENAKAILEKAGAVVDLKPA